MNMHQYFVQYRVVDEIAGRKCPSRGTGRLWTQASKGGYSEARISQKSRRRRSPSRVDRTCLGLLTRHPHQRKSETRPWTGRLTPTQSCDFILNLDQEVWGFRPESPDGNTRLGYNRMTAPPSMRSGRGKPTSIEWGVAVGEEVATQRIPQSGFIKRLKESGPGVRVGDKP